MKVPINPKTIFITLLILIICLLIANLIGIVATYFFEYDDAGGWVALFDFDTEKNIPTFYSSLALMLCSVLLLIIFIKQRKPGYPHLHWLGLAVIFLFLSIDEAISIHERSIEPLREILGTSGLLYYAWVIPYSLGLIVLLALYFGFLLNLPKKIRDLFILSGVVFVSGALGIEMIGGLYTELHGTNNLTYSLITTCEEFLEMLGIVIFIYALLICVTTRELAISRESMTEKLLLREG